MSENRNDKEIEALFSATAAMLRPTTSRLDELVLEPERFMHRPQDALSETRLAPLRESIITENGIHSRITYFVDPQGRKVVVRGHRRTTALRQLAAQKQPGYTEVMEVPTEEIVGGNSQDYLVWSVFDNENRETTDRVSRIKTCKKLYDDGVPIPRAARAMKVDPKTYERDLLIGSHGWMFQHVIDESIAATHALALLTEARKQGVMEEMRADLDDWIASRKREIREKEKIKKLADGKDLRPADKLVKTFMPNHLVTHWVELLKHKRRFDDDAQWDYSASLDKDNRKLQISSIVLDLDKASADKMARVGSKLSMICKQLAPFIQKRHASETGQTVKDAGDEPYDLDYLRSIGMENMAEGLEAKVITARKPDGEVDPTHGQQQEREERDLTADVQLPASQSSVPQDDDNIKE
jgi:hypothetical protein